ncbi:hypothetical protein BTT_61670 (plasmid) [Bacillus thuringiensis serovar morrisoni str. 4AA1]|uniref:hypothetical protein n=1 Tax=Bacillus TaxID=1386 RepID=UPI0005CDF2C1|nr:MULTISPECIES: hypothetical protein [Bacillus]AJQ62807.1 hypothetical protein SD98_31700 [Bacillus thuringiensis serovar morrisoni]MED3102569.1 hypothetical protein [Bacillus thuringiensis]MRA99490.1 hypothetical protein [Bacillus thuringiensis]OTY42685.1 hypothetical protein BK736_09125 [Bacillus thuringiensis serovar poloniensis]RNG23244.1 hypothetical protein EEL55_29090 [Bacillus thuringiensis]
MGNVPNEFSVENVAKNLRLGRYQLIITLTFVNPGEWGKPEPYGTVSMIYNDQVYTIWASTADRELESYTTTLNIPSNERPDKATFIGDVKEYDTGNGNDILAYPDCPVTAAPNQFFKLLGEKDSDGQSYVGCFYTVRDITSPNLLPNGDFENGLDGWVQSQPEANNPRVINILNNKVFETTSGANAYQNVSNIVRNQDYIVLYDTELIGGASSRVEVRDQVNDNVLASSEKTQDGSYILNFTANSNAVKVLLIHANGNGATRFDNIFIIENSKSQQVNALPLPLSSLVKLISKY